MSHMVGEVSLKVYEAPTRDVCRGIARIDYDTMDLLGVSTGEVIEIRGKRRTVARCLPQYPSDEGRGIIRIDGVIRSNAGTSIPGVGPEKKESVTIRKIGYPSSAAKVVVTRIQPLPSLVQSCRRDEGMVPFDKKELEKNLGFYLESIPVVKGNMVVVSGCVGYYEFQVIDIESAVVKDDGRMKPTTKDCVMITSRTIFRIDSTTSTDLPRWNPEELR
jgi:transitional endoplasmic reticulum ATPase